MASKFVEEFRDHLLAFGEVTKAAALTIATRAALRTIPLLEHLSWERPLPKRLRKSLGRQRMSNSEIVLGTFRSAATAWVAARFHAFGMSDRFHEIKHDARVAGGAEDAGNNPAAYAAYATHNAMMVATSVFSQRLPQSSFSESQHRQNAAMIASQAVAAGALGFGAAYAPKPIKTSQAVGDRGAGVNHELSEVERIVWDAAWTDLRRLENGGNDPQSLLTQRLWPTSPQHVVRNDWTNLVSRLRGRTDEHWSVWIDWYEAQLAGPADLLEGEEVARVSLPNDVWARGAASANRSIAGHAV